MHPIVVVFLTVFLAELGDKTQLATLLFATSGQHHPALIFAAAAAALVTATAVAVVLGTVSAHLLAAIPLKLIAGLGFIAIGVWTVYEQLAAR